jgi:hypothetical protein
LLNLRSSGYFLAQQVLQASASLQQSAHLSLQQVAHAEAPLLQQLIPPVAVEQEDKVAMTVRARIERIVFMMFCFVNEGFVLNDSTCQSAFVARPNPAALAGIKLDHAPFRRDLRGIVLKRHLAALNRAGLGASNTTVAVHHFAPPPENAPPTASSNQPQ